MAPYILEHMNRAHNVDPNNPERYIGLCIAQNLLVWDLLDEKLNRNRGVCPESVAYDNMTGSESLRTEIALFASKRIWGRDVDPERVIALAGAGSIIESLFYVISNPSDGVLIPTPSYAGFWMDLETRDELTVVPVHTSSDNNFRLTTDLLEAAYSGSEVPISALMLTNPDNPTGRLMPQDDMREAISWARSHGLHIIVNEIYSLSIHSSARYIPVGDVVDDLGDDIHEVWGFSKDLAMSGVRCGVLTSNNLSVLNAVRELAYWAVVSGDTQHLLSDMLADTSWTDRFLTEMRRRLRVSYEATTAALDAAGIPYIDGDAGLFLLADLRAYLDEETWEGEDRLWREILERANVNLTPGSACRVSEPGFMRICFATEPPEVIALAINRISDVIR